MNNHQKQDIPDFFSSLFGLNMDKRPDDPARRQLDKMMSLLRDTMDKYGSHDKDPAWEEDEDS